MKKVLIIAVLLLIGVMAHYLLPKDSLAEKIIDTAVNAGLAAEKIPFSFDCHD